MAGGMLEGYRKSAMMARKESPSIPGSEGIFELFG